MRFFINVWKKCKTSCKWWLERWTSPTPNLLGANQKTFEAPKKRVKSISHARVWKRETHDAIFFFFKTLTSINSPWPWPWGSDLRPTCLKNTYHLIGDTSNMFTKKYLNAQFKTELKISGLSSHLLSIAVPSCWSSPLTRPPNFHANQTTQLQPVKSCPLQLIKAVFSFSPHCATEWVKMNTWLVQTYISCEKGDLRYLTDCSYDQWLQWISVVF